MAAGFSFAIAIARSISIMPVTPRKLASSTEESRFVVPSGSTSATATERSCAENSSARIFIGDGALVVFGGGWRAHLHDDQVVGSGHEAARAIEPFDQRDGVLGLEVDRKSTRLNSSHLVISYAVFCLKKKTMYDKSKWIALFLLTVVDPYFCAVRTFTYYSRRPSSPVECMTLI